MKVASVRDINWNATRTLTYQAGGDLYQDARSGGITYSYSYNARNRAVEIMKNNVEVGAYGYDAFEHRVWREVFSPSTDLDGRLLAEQNGATGAVVKEYAWIDDMPLAVIDSSSGTPTTYYIHTGPVNEPLAMTNSAKAIVWNAYMEPFGAATVFGTASASIDMRLPGQSLEAETGNLNQNWFRDYDPSLRRYIEADPLGLEAGQNVYSYVQGKPLDYRDPRGLAFQFGYTVGGAAIIPGYGQSLNLTFGLNVDGFNSSIFAQGQAAYATDAHGYFVGFGDGWTASFGSSPDQGPGSGAYSEQDIGLLVASASLSQNYDNCGNLISAAGAKGREGPALGVGRFNGNQSSYTGKISINDILAFINDAAIGSIR